MKTDKHRFLLCLAIILTFSLSNFAQSQIVSETVEKFYKFHRIRSGIVSTHELNLRKTWLTSELAKLFRNEIKREDEFTRKHPNDKPYFGDGFPFQPFEECVIDNKIILNRLEIGKVEINANKAMVEVKFFIPKECEDQVEKKLLDTYQVELVKSKTRWLINDWIYADGKKLSNVLRRVKY